MVLITCQYCGSSISDKAIRCPKCFKSPKSLKINLFSAYLKFWFRSGDFKGTAFLKEFWFGFISIILMDIFCLLIINNLNVIDNPSRFAGIIYLISLLHLLGSIISIFTGTIRRIRDAGRSPYFILWNLLPVVGQLMTIVVLFEKKNRKLLEYWRYL